MSSITATGLDATAIQKQAQRAIQFAKVALAYTEALENGTVQEFLSSADRDSLQFLRGRTLQSRSVEDVGVISG